MSSAISMAAAISMEAAWQQHGRSMKNAATAWQQQQHNSMNIASSTGSNIRAAASAWHQH
jgi:hypothetical protein